MTNGFSKGFSTRNQTKINGGMTMTIRIALTNLGKYNEGELVYEWLELPATQDEIEAAFESIGVDGVRYEEHFITDYEAPFKIEEYDSVTRLNELAEELGDIPEPTVTYLGSQTFKDYNVQDVISFAHAHGQEDHVDGIIHDDQLNEMVHSMANDPTGDWTRIRIFLNHADATAEWHSIDGYGNIERLTDDELDRIVSDIISDIKAGL